MSGMQGFSYMSRPAGRVPLPPPRRPPFAMMDGTPDGHFSPTRGSGGNNGAPVEADDTFDILDWYPAYMSCQRFFLDHAQHEPATQALCALINIRLPHQWPQHPIHSSSSSSPAQPGNAAFGYFGAGGVNVGSPDSSRASQQRQQQQMSPNPVPNTFVSLIPYIRRLVVTAFDQPGILHGFFGDDYVRGVMSHVECERRNYLFAAKHGGWRSCKKQYDSGSGGGVDESVPFLKPLDHAKILELNAADRAWSSWLAMEDWMVGPRAPTDDTSPASSQSNGQRVRHEHRDFPGNLPGGVPADLAPPYGHQ